MTQDHSNDARSRKFWICIGSFRWVMLSLPPAVLFLFDRMDVSEKEIADVIRESEGKVRFCGDGCI